MTGAPQVVSASGGSGFDRYRTALRGQPVAVNLECAQPEGFTCTFRSMRVGDLDVADISSASGGVTRAERAERLIRASDPEAYRLMLNAHGNSRFQRDGRCAHLTPGAMALFDSSQPYTTVRWAPHRYLMVTFPRALISLPHQRVARSTVVAWPERAPLVRAVSSLMYALTGPQPVSPLAAPGLSLAFVELVTATLVEEFSVDAATPGSSPHALWIRMSSFVDDHLGDPDLGVARLAAEHHVSPRTVQRLFANAGTTVTEHIRERRLEHCRRDLSSPALDTVPVYVIAVRRGFTSAPHFTRAFTRRYGVSPQLFRRLRLPSTNTSGRERRNGAGSHETS